MSAAEFVRRFVTVHKCGGCGKILDFEHSEGAFCAACSLAFNSSITESCESCFKPAIECECMPKPLSKAGALCLRRLFFYKSEAPNTPQMRIIYWLKYKNSRRIVSFVANEFYKSVKSELDVLGLESDELLICGVPRSKKARMLHGFDQSEMVAKRLSALLGIPYARLLDTRLFSKEQKKLGRASRLRNARARIKLCRGTDLRGKYVILFDDIVTTGASMVACVELLRKNGCKGVLCFALSSSQKL